MDELDELTFERILGFQRAWNLQPLGIIRERERAHLASRPMPVIMCVGYTNSALNFIIPVSDLPACAQAGLTQS